MPQPQRPEKKDPDTRREPAGPDPEQSGTRYLNTTTTPLVYDDEGHTVDAGEWTPSVNLDAIGRAARRNGHLRPPSALP